VERPVTRPGAPSYFQEFGRQWRERRSLHHS
jgi:hypothetical protein